MCSRGRCLLDLQGVFHRNPLICSILVRGLSSVDSLFGEFVSPGAVPVHQIVHVKMMEMMMDDLMILMMRLPRHCLCIGTVGLIRISCWLMSEAKVPLLWFPLLLFAIKAHQFIIVSRIAMYRTNACSV